MFLSEEMEWQTTNQRRNEILMISCALSIPPKEKTCEGKEFISL